MVIHHLLPLLPLNHQIFTGWWPPVARLAYRSVPLNFSGLPSGQRLQKTMENHHVLWVIQL